MADAAAVPAPEEEVPAEEEAEDIPEPEPEPEPVSLRLPCRIPPYVKKPEVPKVPAIPPLDLTKPIPKVFQRFEGAEVPEFLQLHEEETPKKRTALDDIEETQLSKEQLKVLKDAFDIFDSEQKGSISIDVIQIILEMFTGEKVNEDDLDDLMDEFDEDENGEIEFSEFIELAEHFVEPEPEYAEVKRELREAFLLYDKKQQGYVPAADFKKILKEIDPEVAENELDQIVDEIDQDSSGTIDFDEFIEVMLGDEK